MMFNWLDFNNILVEQLPNLPDIGPQLRVLRFGRHQCSEFPPQTGNPNQRSEHLNPFFLRYLLSQIRNKAILVFSCKVRDSLYRLFTGLRRDKGGCRWERQTVDPLAESDAEIISNKNGEFNGKEYRPWVGTGMCNKIV